MIDHVTAHHPYPIVRRRSKGAGKRDSICTRHSQHLLQSLIRSAAEAKIREADRLECEAWNAIMWAGGPAMPSPGEPQAEPTIAKAINGGFYLLEAKGKRCDPGSLVPLPALRHPPGTPGWKLGASLP